MSDQETIFQQIIDMAGYDAAMTLALNAGGCRVYIPKLSPNSDLERLVGIDFAAAISRAAPSAYFEVPLANERLLFWLEKKGWSQNQIARRLRLARRTVQYHLTNTVHDFPAAGDHL